jgi:hypothetical protein
MKYRIRILACLASLLVATSCANAVVLFQDNFPYSSGPIGPASGGSAITAGGGVWVSGAGSFYGTTADISASGANSLSIAGTTTSDLPRAYFTNGLAGLSMPKAPLFTNTVYFLPTNAPVGGIYASFMLNVPTVSGTIITNTYIAYFSDTNFDFPCRVFVVTNTAGSGNYRLALANSSSPSVPTTTANNILATDLNAGTTYTVVVRYAPATGICTLWVNPAVETSTSLTPSGTGATTVYLGSPSTSYISGTNSVANSAICGFGVRNHIGGGPLNISSLIVGTTFEDVVPASAGNNPAFIATGPHNSTNFAGDTTTFSVVAGGDTNGLSYQWESNNVTISDVSNPDGSSYTGTATPTLTVANIQSGEQATYKVVVANTALPGGVTASASLTVVASTAPTWVTQPTNTSVTLAGTATFTASAVDGGPQVSYQWYSGSQAISSQTNATLSLQTATFGQAGPYHVTASNSVTTITSTNATLIVNPPPTVNIAFLRSTLNPTNFTTNGASTSYTVTGTVTVWTNMTTPGNSEFWIQDTNAGIAVFWSGAPAITNQPPAGSIVQITAPLAIFDGELELEPTFGNPFTSVTVIGHTNLPAPTPLPFDTKLVTNLTIMSKNLAGTYFVVTNAFLNFDSSATFSSGAAENITNGFLAQQAYSLSVYNATNATKGTNFTVMFTNQNGQLFDMFYNSHTDIGGKAKPTGPVTMYGIMDVFEASSPYTNPVYQFFVSRYADIIPALLFTNVLSNPVRLGDALTNTYTANTLQPGETITTTVVAADPGGGSTSLSAAGDLSGHWNIISSGGPVATAVFTYTATVGDAGTTYNPYLMATYSSSGVTSSNGWNLYIPTLTEQGVYITEVFSSPTTNTTSPAFNPLKRTYGTNNPAVNDQYVEFANISGSSTSINRWTLQDGSGNVLHQFIGGESLDSGFSAVIYGGPASGDPDAPALSITGLEVFEVASGTLNLALSTNGGLIGLYDPAGNLVDRVAYPASSSPTAGSFTRFPTLKSGFVPESWVSTNWVTPGSQYDGGSWANPTQIPTGVTGITLSGHNPLALNFTAITTQASTLWQGGSVIGAFQVINGQQFGTPSGVFNITNPTAPQSFYYITTQTNGVH